MRDVQLVCLDQLSPCMLRLTRFQNVRYSAESRLFAAAMGMAAMSHDRADGPSKTYPLLPRLSRTLIASFGLGVIPATLERSHRSAKQTDFLQTGKRWIKGYERILTYNDLNG